MIRVTCPKCQKKLGLEAGAAGLVIACPSCKHKFRAPKESAPEGEADSAAVKKAESKRAPTVKPASKRVPVVDKVELADAPIAPSGGVRPAGKDADEPPAAAAEVQAGTPEQSGQTYTVFANPEAESKPKPKPKKMTKEEMEAEMESLESGGMGLDAKYLKQRKQKRKKAVEGQLLSGLSNYMLIVLISLLFWVVLAGLIFVKPQIAIVLVILGGVVYVGASIWFIVEAFLESLVWGLVVLFVPLAPLVFLLMHTDRALKPFMLMLMGVAMAFTPLAVTKAKGEMASSSGACLPRGSQVVWVGPASPIWNRG